MTDPGYVVGSIRKCRACGKEFKVRNNNQIYCCVNCRLKAQEDRRQERVGKLPMKVCPICGRSYHPCHKKQKYCSRQCAAKGKGWVELGQHAVGQSEETCKVRIIKSINIYQELQPVKGEIYPAMFCEGRNGNDFVILDIAGKKIVVRQGEYEIVE